MNADQVRQPCDGCAFTKGTAANSEPQSHLKGILCTLGPSPFWCHSTVDWKNTPSRMSHAEFQSQEFHICGGWTREVRKLAEAGYFKVNPIWKRGLAQAGLEALEIFVSTSGDESEEGKDTHQYFQNVLHSVVKQLSGMARKFRRRDAAIKQ